MNYIKGEKREEVIPRPPSNKKKREKKKKSYKNSLRSEQINFRVEAPNKHFYDLIF